MITAQGEEYLAQLLVGPLVGAGFTVSHDGTILVGESQIAEPARLMASGAPVVLCGTVRAVGTAWAHKLVNAAHASIKSRVYVVQMEEQAYIEQLSLNTKVARYDQDAAQACTELIAALSAHYPPLATSNSLEGDAFDGQFLDASSDEVTFDPDALSWFRDQMRDELKVQYPASLLPSEFLSRSSVLIGSALSRAGVLLFASKPDSLFPTAMIQCALYDGVDRSADRKVARITGPVPYQILAAREFVAGHVLIGEASSDDQAQAKPVYRFPMKAVREIIANAVVHRSYEKTDSCVHVRVFDDRIEITSPGAWYSSVVPDAPITDLAELETDSHCRNFRLAHLLSTIKLVEGEGSGIPTSLADCREIGAPQPQVTRAPDSVTVVLRPRTELPGSHLEVGIAKRSIFPRDMTAGIERALSEISPPFSTSFEAEYLRVVSARYDRLELLGVNLLHRAWSLTQNYVALPLRTVADSARDIGAISGTVGVDYDPLRLPSRLLITGSAGSGKTTMLQWIAVWWANHLDEPKNAESEALIPFFIQLRRYSSSMLPLPEQFCESAASWILDAMPTGWVHHRLRSGRAIVLIDGLDELQANQREDALKWLGDLVELFPAARYVVTSRPSAAPINQLDNLRFVACHIEPMPQATIIEYVNLWFASNINHDDLPNISEVIRTLLTAISQHAYLQDLASNPLTCTLLCSVVANRRGHLPSERTELYAMMIEMFTARRDMERGIPAVFDFHDRRAIVHILADLAYWMSRNDTVDVTTDQVLQRLERQLQMLPPTQNTARSLYAFLLERSGLLLEIAPGRVSFVHRTFQEYLAAMAAVDADDLGLLVESAHLSNWQEIVIFACSHATVRQCDELLTRLISRVRRDTANGNDLIPVIFACVESTHVLSQGLRAEIASLAIRNDHGEEV